MSASRVSQRHRKKGGVVSAVAHHFVSYNCICESGNLLEGEDAETWCKDADAVRSLKDKSFKQCAAILKVEAEAIAGLESTSPFDAPYVYRFVHLAFPAKKFQTKEAAANFMAQAFKSDDPVSILRPYLKDLEFPGFSGQ